MHIATGKYSDYFFFSFTGCKIQAGSSACGRCSHWWSGGGSYWSPCRLQSSRNCSCTWWWDFGLHRWKIDTKEKTKNDRADLFQLSRAFSPKCQKIQLKYRFIMARNNSVVAELMTDLQPYALYTRLSCVNFDDSSVPWEGWKSRVRISLFRHGDISPLKIIWITFNYIILR